MALVDSIFSSIPGPLINQFGISATYIKVSQSQTYDPNTGTVSSSFAEIPVKIIIQALKLQETEGKQESSVKIILSAAELGEYYPGIADSIRYTQNGRINTLEITSIESYRGDRPVMHTLIGKVSKSSSALSRILLESGDSILLEDGGLLLLEA